MTNSKISPNRQKKIEAVEKLTVKIKKAKSLVLADYSSIEHKQLEEFRSKLKKLTAEFNITKNNLLQRALTQSGNSLDTELTGPTATLFSYDDEIAPLKELVRFFKQIDKGTIKLGILDNQVLSENEVTRFSSLPTKQELHAKAVGQIAAPLSGMVRALNWNINKLAWTLEEIRKTRQESMSA